MAAWEQLTPRDKSLVGLTTRMRADGILSMSADVVEAMGNPVKVNVLLDRDKKKIRLEPASDDSPGAYKVSRSGVRGKLFLLNTKRALEIIGVDPADAKGKLTTVQDGNAIEISF